MIDEVLIPGPLMREIIAAFADTRDNPDLSDDVWLKLAPKAARDEYDDLVYIATDIA